ncbi:MAG: lipoate--protein ligase [Bacteroidetes bacterium]|nr:MAG: lipoate--protein ligase [Bacteroidota bacterium]
MLCIRSTTLDPAFNLATEEFLLRHREEDCFYLYINRPSIIVGRHQNSVAEINEAYVRAEGIDVIRRMSGGGAVFHDPGNLNFTFIRQAADKSVDFRKYTRPILDVLNEMGVDARFEGRNDLTIGGKKFSGNAQCHYNGRILQHGTLLFSSNLPDLSKALKVNPLKYRDKAVKSVRSRVTNISEHLADPIGLEEFEDRIIAHVMALYTDSRLYTLSDADRKTIAQLVKEKYGTWEWNFGSSPRYNFQKGIRTSGGHVELNLEVKNGVIEKARIFGDFFNMRELAELEELLTGLAHEKGEIQQRLKEVALGDYMANVSPDEFLDGLF